MGTASITHEERNAIILRRTLSTGSWLYGFWTGMFAAMTLSIPASGRYDGPLLLGHAALLGLAGFLLWRPRPLALAATLVAVAGSIFFVVLDVQRHNIPSALVDGAYVLLAAVLLYKSRRRP